MTWLAIWKFIKGIAGALAGLADFVPGWIWASALAAAMATTCVHTHQRDSARASLSSLQAAVKADAIERTELARRAEADRRERMGVFEAALAAINLKEANEKQALAADVSRLRGELRQRPQRTAGAGAVSGGSGSAVGGCTGAGLYREDGDFLVGEAAAAKTLARQLASCRSKYNEAVALTRRPLAPGLSVLTGAPVSTPAKQP